MNNHNTQVIEIIIRNNTYRVACNKTEEPHLLKLAEQFNSLVTSISAAEKGKGSDALIFLLAGLTLTDEKNELKAQLKKVKDEMLMYKKYFDDYLKIKNDVNNLLSHTLLRIEKLLQYLEFH
ncbi:cell division protein ZapA [Ehrlichia ruminantium]|uniref:Cell division protein ZapA n=1 Tax=Ehrlichia ruminantium TaxID=779 RepID=A0AAE6UIM8_EHRRU|nr:cell division protein ZapA [Ehrlichia ruminantium]QGR03597.1 cell division protein ZapA [Ehrlichia ruminantium]QGR04524.1 cell division protein ZapA [Ehrlichia ruminantium]